jgi:hypothetical protein
MFFDTGLNSASTMLSNIHRAFTETATKMWAYARCLPAPKQPPPKLIISTQATAPILRLIPASLDIDFCVKEPSKN